MKKIIVALAQFFVLTDYVHAENLPKEEDYSGTYVCNIIAAAGIRQEAGEKTWNSTRFTPENQIITFYVKSDALPAANLPAFSYEIQIKAFGDKGLPSQCLHRSLVLKQIIPDAGTIDCTMSPYEVRVNFKSLRIQYYAPGSYVTNGANDNPTIGIGTCEKVSKQN